jgi:superfamily II DNA or RNA helicase
VASFGTFSTGINIPNLQHLVLASPSKSKIRIIQSIGRSLRLHESKSHATLWDIVDDLSYGKSVNYALRHAEERSRLYATEKFPVALKKISLENAVLL